MKKTPGKTPSARERYWKKIIAEARRYPKGVTEYCRVMNVSKNNYYSWFKKLRAKHPEWHDLTNSPEILVPRQQVTSATDEEHPQTEVNVKARRKKWSADERERIIQETDNLSGGDLGAVLRREGVYVHTLNKWRTQRDLLNIANSKKVQTVSAQLAAENKKLKEDKARLEKKLLQANEIIQLQKKISEMLGMALNSIEEP
jgi:transposase-like protein